MGEGRRVAVVFGRFVTRQLNDLKFVSGFWEDRVLLWTTRNLYFALVSEQGGVLEKKPNSCLDKRCLTSVLLAMLGDQTLLNLTMKGNKGRNLIVTHALTTGNQGHPTSR